VKNVILAIFSIVLLSGPGYASEDQVIRENRDKVSYSLGYQIGDDFKQQGMDLDTEALLKGVEDALAQMEPRISRDEMQETLLEMKHKIEASTRQEKQAAKEAYKGEDREWLAENVKKQGVIVLPSGLQYKVIVAGSGKSPGPDDTVTVHYRGTTLKGAEFYNSHRGEDKPASFHVGAVIRGMSEALQLMKEGGQWQLFIPADLAYGERGPVGEQAVIFEVELISIESSQ